ncbi:tRNA (adenosine(37)-N6)-dimethylallyltransferase MiaA [bacterium]|uniref:tRNA dimethylallyltransferase n=1 Tax=Candidatus Scatenecus faecavium TaxID=2840915 RepID=A0A9D1FXS4_9BACT|nr:tRNA (adenosine(37)-N6)-dimethylallyltransferase MiaA [bacterium]HIS83396.1 tRNA (adenosine(37)-N6)-dimethylallyltransferase MiaA [Candidatus Scatenecus faecavium]
MKKSKPKVIAVVGPTASGKTSYAVSLAHKFNGEIVSADSRLVYKGFDIGTAKPSLEECEGVPHHMIDIVEPEIDYSAGLFAEEAKKAVDDILSRGKTPIVAGGTGLYFRLLLENYDVPKVPPDYELREKLSAYTYDELRKMLEKFDPQRAAEIELNDKKKVIRAIEMAEHLEKPLSEYRKELEFDVEWIGLNFPREELYERINVRVDMMVKAGLVEETENLLQKHGRIKNLTCTIGYQEMIAYLDNQMTLDEAKGKLKQNSRNYAKRQLTWFRKNPLIKWNCEPVRLKK